MVRIDLSSNPRIPILLDMVGSIRRAHSAREVLEAFIRGMQLAYGPRCYVGISKRGLGADEYRIIRWLTYDGGDRIKPAEIGEEVFEKPVLRGGILGELTATPEPKLIHHLRIEDDPVIRHRLDRYGSLVAVPLIEADLTLDWAILFHEGPTTFTPDDLESLIIRANLINATVDNVHVSEKLIEATGHIQREVNQIASIQKSLLPQVLPEIPGVRMAASYKTFDRAGGDYYDVFPVACLENGGDEKKHRWLILIADAAGHGPAAAVLMAVFHAILHTFEKHASGPTEVLEYINKHIYERFHGLAMMTAFMGFYEPRSRRLVYSNAGHHRPLLRRPGPLPCVVDLASSDGIPIGVQEIAGVSESSMILEPGQTLVLYTDGITDERSSERIPFGQERLRKAALDFDDPQVLVDELNRQLLEHQGITQPEDDQTLLAMRIEE